MTVEIALLRRVLPEDRIPDGPERDLTVTPEQLDAFLAERADHARVRPDEVLDGEGPRLLCTCDGAREEFVDHALPVLERHGVHCVLFVATDWARGLGEPFEDALWRALCRSRRVEIPLEGFVALDTHARRRRAFDALSALYAPLPAAERDGLVAALADPGAPAPSGFLGPEAIRALAAHPLLTIGALSRSHPFLPRLRPERLAAEVGGSKREVEQWLGARVDWFAYPYGAHDRAVRRCVDAAGFRFACGAEPGPFDASGVDRLALPRTDLALCRA